MTRLSRNPLSFLLIAALMSSCGAEQHKATNVTASRVSIAEVQMQESEEQFDYSGSIEADNTVSLGFSIPGRITSIAVQEGQHIRKGQLLASIETNDYQSALEIATAVYDQAADNFKRLNELYQKGSLPERDFISAKSAMAQAGANKSMAGKRMADTRLYAPFTGIVTEKITETGASAAPGVPVLTLVKTDQVYARASVTESEISSLSKGVNAIVEVPVLNKKLTGKITIINPRAETSSRTYEVKIKIDNNEGKLLPGMIANIRIETGKKKETIVIPAQAILRDADHINYVFITKDGQTAVKKRITTSGVNSGNQVVIMSGIKPGDQLILSGHTRLEDGSPIKFAGDTK
ncbi:efflux RND transporter periplasmic adaptor subunit [Pedobacter caeni]|uniref:RND family efflux transporter, MFP subunit n=1 Tax=Pedobacter caeni TaxID=288992 RepID=A0A1M5B3Q8_9SPHI|nr:efflux RND transporter periplasmic adaptor subunit [Pedobacter caeni]SHF37099.1 RND family efflux transporter, MFP subunit [Pedobacter caeni]